MNTVPEKRKYIRLNTVFPVEFQIVSKEDRRPISDLYEGFTRNIAKGGMGIFAKTLKEKDRQYFDFKPHLTKLRMIINIPLDKEPIESFATVEWVDKKSGPIVDIYTFGVSYDFINELEYEKILSYAKWLRLKPKLAFFTIVLLVTAFAVTAITLVQLNRRRLFTERHLLKSLAENKKAKIEKLRAQQRKHEAETELEAAKSRQIALQAAFNRVSEKKKALEDLSKVSEEDRENLQSQIEELEKEKASLVEQMQVSAPEEEEIPAEETAGVEEDIGGISEDRLRAEEANYNNFRELILNEKLQSLSAYVSTHRSSIYHAAALFAFAELRYKNGDKTLSAVSYKQVIDLYPQSKYALYASHRLEQLQKNRAYSFYTLKDFYDTYNLPELFDYRNIEPYIR